MKPLKTTRVFNFHVASPFAWDRIILYNGWLNKDHNRCYGSFTLTTTRLGCQLLCMTNDLWQSLKNPKFPNMVSMMDWITESVFLWLLFFFFFLSFRNSQFCHQKKLKTHIFSVILSITKREAILILFQQLLHLPTFALESFKLCFFTYLVRNKTQKLSTQVSHFRYRLNWVGKE